MSNSHTNSDADTVVLGAGCFWCFDAVLRRTGGIVSSVAGFSGDAGPPPRYEDHVRGLNPQNFVEAVRLEFRPAEISFDEVLALFFQSHDPTTPNRDGANRGSEYHSTIFYSNEEQHRRSVEFMKILQKELKRKIVTSLRPFEVFYEADAEHQDYYGKNLSAPYCRAVIEPKLSKLGLAD